MGQSWQCLLDFSKSLGYVGQEVTPASVNGNALISPSQNLLYSALGQLETFKGCIAGQANVGGDSITALGDNWSTHTRGSVTLYVGKSIWFIGGSGTVKAQDPANANASVTIGTMSSLLQIAVLVGSVYQTAVQAGLSAPDAPVLAGMTPTAGFTGKNTGTFSAEITKVRTSTGAESNPSPPSNVVAVTAQSIAIQIPGPPTDGTDEWNVYVTPNGFADTGPFLFLQTINEVDLTDTGHGTMGAASTTWTRVSGHTLTAADVGKQIVVTGGPTTTIASVNVGAQTAVLDDPSVGAVTNVVTTFNAFANGMVRAVEIEWSDGELIISQEPPIDHFPPPSGTQCAAIGNIMNVGGCYGGVGWACSDPGQAEAYNPDNVSFLSEPLLFCIGRPQDGFIYLICANSISAAVYTGAINGPPVMVRQVWDRVGVAGFSAAGIYGKVLYLFTTGNAIARTGPDGNLDFSFSQVINDDIASWDATKVSVAYDDNRQAMCFVHDQEILCWHIEQNRWSTPLNLAAVTGLGNPTGTITGAYTQAGRMYLLAHESANYNLYKFDETGSGKSTWFWTISWQNGSVGHNIKTTKKLLLDYSANESTSLHGTMAASSTTFTKTSGTAIVAGDVNKQIIVTGAGDDGADLTTTIFSVNTGAQTAVLNDAATTAVTAVAATINPFIAGSVYNFNNGTSTAVGTFASPLPAATKILQWIRANIKAGDLFAIKIAGVGSTEKFYALVAEGSSSSIQ